MKTLISLLFVPLIVFAEERDDITYRALSERVKNGDLSVDFRALRLACMRSDLCQPRGSTGDLSAMQDAANRHDAARGLETALRMIDQGYVNAEAHAACVDFYTWLNRPDEARFHADVYRGLMGSIFRSGDGKSPDTAFEVICTREESLVLIALKLPPYGQTASEYVATATHRILKLELPDAKTERMVTVFFNEDAIVPEKNRPRH